MPLKGILTVLLCLLAPTVIFAKSDNSNGLEPRVTALEGRADTLEGRADTLEGRTDTLEGRTDTLEGRTDTLEGRADTLEGRADTLEDRVDALEELTVLQQGEIDQNADDIVDLQNASGGGSGGPDWVVMDSDDQEVGTLVSIGNSFQAVVELSAGGETFLVTAQRDGIQQFYQPLYYTSTDCTADEPGEEVFASVSIDELQNIVIFAEPGFPQSRVAYQVGDIQTFAKLGSYSVAGGCSGYPYSFDVLPVTAVSGDLHLDYPPPYALARP